MEYCRDHNLEVVHQYVDEAQSGTNDRRISFQKMIKDAEAREWDYVVVYKMDRFSRSVSDALHYQKILQGFGIDILSVIEDFDNETPEGGFFNLITMGMSQLYVQNLRRSVMAGLRQNAKKGIATGGIPPLGYDYNDSMVLVPNPTEAETVKIIFTMAADGHSYTEIARRLESEGRKTKLGGNFIANFNEILKNRKYIGEYVYNRSVPKNQDGKRNHHQNKAEFEIIRIPNAHPAIVDQETFVRVQEILRRRVRRRGGRPHVFSKYMLAGRIKCQVCGSAFFGDFTYSGRNKSPRFRYVCGSKNATPCANRDITMASLDGFIKDFLKRYMLNPIYAKKWLEITKNGIEAFKNFNKQRSKELSIAIEEKEKEIKELIQKVGDAKRNTEKLIIDEIRTLDLEQANMSTEYQALQIELARIRRPTQKMIISEMKSSLRTLKEEPQKIARKFISKIVIGNSEIKVNLDLRAFSGVEKLVFDINYTIDLQREMIVKAKFVKWDYDFTKITYYPADEWSRVKLLSGQDLPQS
jgi:site-specific DNA recombinase